MRQLPRHQAKPKAPLTSVFLLAALAAACGDNNASNDSSSVGSGAGGGQGGSGGGAEVVPVELTSTCPDAVPWLVCKATRNDGVPIGEDAEVEARLGEAIVAAQVVWDEIHFLVPDAPEGAQEVRFILPDGTPARLTLQLSKPPIDAAAEIAESKAALGERLAVLTASLQQNPWLDTETLELVESGREDFDSAFAQLEQDSSVNRETSARFLAANRLAMVSELDAAINVARSDVAAEIDKALVLSNAFGIQLRAGIRIWTLARLATLLGPGTPVFWGGIVGQGVGIALVADAMATAFRLIELSFRPIDVWFPPDSQVAPTTFVSGVAKPVNLDLRARRMNASDGSSPVGWLSVAVSNILRFADFTKKYLPSVGALEFAEPGERLLDFSSASQLSVEILAGDVTGKVGGTGANPSLEFESTATSNVDIQYRIRWSDKGFEAVSSVQSAVVKPSSCIVEQTGQFVRYECTDENNLLVRLEECTVVEDVCQSVSITFYDHAPDAEVPHQLLNMQRDSAGNITLSKELRSATADFGGYIVYNQSELVGTAEFRERDFSTTPCQARLRQTRYYYLPGIDNACDTGWNASDDSCSFPMCFNFDLPTPNVTVDLIWGINPLNKAQSFLVQQGLCGDASAIVEP